MYNNGALAWCFMKHLLVEWWTSLVFSFVDFNVCTDVIESSTLSIYMCIRIIKLNSSLPYSCVFSIFHATVSYSTYVRSVIKMVIGLQEELVISSQLLSSYVSGV